MSFEPLRGCLGLIEERPTPPDLPVFRTLVERLPVLNCALSRAVLRGPGPASGAGHHGVGAAGERPGHLPSGRHEVSAGLLPG